MRKQKRRNDQQQHEKSAHGIASPAKEHKNTDLPRRCGPCHRFTTGQPPGIEPTRNIGSGGAAVNARRVRGFVLDGAPETPDSLLGNCLETPKKRELVRRVGHRTSSATGARSWASAYSVFVESTRKLLLLATGM